MTRRIDPGLIPSSPDLSFEKALWKEGLLNIAGIDEAGRGCLAGPVFAAAVILPNEPERLRHFSLIRDSKQLSAQTRTEARKIVEEFSMTWGVGQASNAEIDRFGIMQATRLAVSRALDGLSIQPDHLLVDYIQLPNNPLPQTRLVKGDARSKSIAAASILAKTYRDSLMICYGGDYPEYNFASNKGYGTAEHKGAIQRFGPTPLHRLSFAPMRDL
jgi:ribonuclease HII